MRRTMDKPIVTQVFSDNGEHSHWALVDAVSGIKLWSEDPRECAAMGHPVEDLSIGPEPSGKSFSLDEAKIMLRSPLNDYIRSKHTQEECIGFIDGFNAAVRVVSGGLDLERMERQLDEALENETPESLMAFLEEKRGKHIGYAECIENQDEVEKKHLTVGKIYPIIEALPCGRYVVTDDEGDNVKIYSRRFKPSNRVDFLKQSLSNTPSFASSPDGRWKVGEYCYSGRDKICLGRIMSIDEDMFAYVEVDGYPKKQAWNLEYCLKPDTDDSL